MTSYYKLINLDNGDLVSINKNEKIIFDLKFTLENKGGFKLKLLKCFGNDEYKRDFKRFMNKTKSFWEEVNADNTCYY